MYAIRGIVAVIDTETNMKIHVLAMITIVGLALYVQLSRLDWMILIMCIGWIITMEMINTAIEQFCDFVQDDIDPLIGRIKDIAAGAVLISAITVFIIGFMLFLPYINLVAS